MQIPLSIILDHLAPWSPRCCPAALGEAGRSFRGVRLCYEGQTEFCPEVLYLLPRGASVPEGEGQVFLAVDGEIRPAGESSLILTEFDGPPEQLCGLLADRLYAYAEWDRKADRAILEGCTEQELLDLSQQLLENPLILQDPTFSCVAVSPNVTPEDVLYYDLKLHRMPSNELMKVLVKHNEIKRRSVYGHFGPGRTYRIAPGPTGTDEIYVDISRQDELVMSMNMRFTRRQPTPGFLAFLGLFTEKLAMLCAQREQRQSFSKELSLSEYVFGQIISGNCEVIELLHGSDLLAHDYIIVTAKDSGMRMAAQKGLSVIPGAHTFGFQEQIFLFVPVDILDEGSQYSLTRQHERLRQLARDFSQRLAASGPFRELALLKSACLQAIRTYEYSVAHTAPEPEAVREDPLAEYRQYAFQDMAAQYGRAYPVGSYASPSYLAMRESDRQKDTNYCAFVKAYIFSGCNIARTARECFLHKNSVIYRIEKIRQLFGLDLSDVREQLLFLLACGAEDDLDRPQ